MGMSWSRSGGDAELLTSLQCFCHSGYQLIFFRMLISLEALEWVVVHAGVGEVTP